MQSAKLDRVFVKLDSKETERPATSMSAMVSTIVMKMPTAPTPKDPIFVPVKPGLKEMEKLAQISTSAKV